MKNLNDRIVLNLSQMTETEAGVQLATLYYRTNVLDVFAHGVEIFGYPNNGVEHSLTIKAKVEDIIAFFDLLDSVYGGYFDTFVNESRERLQKVIFN